jgi:hypothetical protein
MEPRKCFDHEVEQTRRNAGAIDFDMAPFGRAGWGARTMILVSHFVVKGITAMFCSLTHEKPEKLSGDCAARLAQTRSVFDLEIKHHEQESRGFAGL